MRKTENGGEDREIILSDELGLACEPLPDKVNVE